MAFTSTGDLTVNGALDARAGLGGQNSSDSATAGGRGGDLKFSVTGDVTITGAALFAASTGGRIDGTGQTGRGGHADVTVGGRMTVQSTLNVVGGLGGEGINGGGQTGVTNFTVSSMDVTGLAEFHGGLGALGDVDSGPVTVTLTDASRKNVFSGGLSVYGSVGKNGGAGGSVYWNNSNSDVHVGGIFTLTGGEGANNPGSGGGGSALFAVNTLENWAAVRAIKSPPATWAPGPAEPAAT